MKRSEWIEELQNAWEAVNDWNIRFSNANFSEDAGETSEDANSYIEMVKEELYGIREGIDGVEECLNKLECVIENEGLVDEEDMEVN